NQCTITHVSFSNVRAAPCDTDYLNAARHDYRPAITASTDPAPTPCQRPPGSHTPHQPAPCRQPRRRQRPASRRGCRRTAAVRGGSLCPPDRCPPPPRTIRRQPAANTRQRRTRTAGQNPGAAEPVSKLAGGFGTLTSVHVRNSRLRG